MLYGFIIGAVMIFAYARWLEPRRLRVEDVEIAIPGLDPPLDGLTILHLSDLHQARFGREQKGLLAAIRQDYQLAVITGDFLTDLASYDFSPTAQLLAGLKPPIFVVLGNHDYPQEELLEADLRKAGAIPLRNACATVEHLGLQVAGVEDPHWAKLNPLSPYRPDLADTLAGAKEGMFTLLLSHSPEIHAQAALAQIPLVLAGHTHGGQVKIPLLGAPITASGRFFDSYVQGLYRKEKTLLYINRGLGTSGLPLRFLSPPEVSFIRLKRA